MSMTTPYYLAPLSMPVDLSERIDIARVTGFDGVSISKGDLVDIGGFNSETKLRKSKMLKILNQNSDLNILNIGLGRVSDLKSLHVALDILDIGIEISVRYAQVILMKEDLRWQLGVLAKLCGKALSSGTKISIEYTPYAGIKTYGQGVSIIRKTEFNNIGICLDTLHHCRSGGGTEELIRQGLDFTHYIQLSDGPKLLNKLVSMQDLEKEALTKRVAPGEGDLPLREILGIFDYQTPVEIEVPFPVGGEGSRASHVEHLLKSAKNLTKYMKGAKDDGLFYT